MSVAKPLAHDAAALHVTGAARYIDDIPVLPTTLRVLEKTLDMRVPLTFSVDDCDVIAAIIEDEISQFRSN